MLLDVLRVRFEALRFQITHSAGKLFGYRLSSAIMALVSKLVLGICVTIAARRAVCKGAIEVGQRLPQYPRESLAPARPLGIVVQRLHLFCLCLAPSVSTLSACTGFERMDAADGAG